MNIQIEKALSREEYMDRNLTLQKMYRSNQKDNKFYIILTAGVFFASGIFTPELTFYNMNAFFSLGLAFFLIFLLLIIGSITTKKNFYNESMQYYSRHSKNGYNIKLQLTNEYVKYQNLEINMELKWSIFSEYKQMSNYLFLFTKKYTLAPIVIDQNHLSENQFAELFDFLNNSTIKSE